MARDFGTVRRDKKAITRAYWIIDCRVDGRRYKLRGFQTRSGKWMRFKTREDAEEALGEIRADLRSGRNELQAISDFLPTGAPEMEFQRHYRRFCAAKMRQGREGLGRQLSDKRIDEFRGHERRGYLDPLLRVSIHGVTFGVLEDWRDWLFEEHDLAPKTVHHLIADVGTCLRWLHRRGEIEGCPALPEVQIPEYAPRIPTPEAQDAILDAIPWAKRGAFLARGLMGLRPSEAARANVLDYDFDRHLLTIHGKGGRVRFLPAPAAVVAWIEEHVERPARLRDASAPAVPLFPNRDASNPGQRWTPASARRVMLAAMRATGLKFKPNEALRHAFATDAVNRGVGVDRVGHYLGHSSTKTTARYAKISGEGLVDVPRETVPALSPPRNPPRK